jgi:uncharacterized protein (TIGR03435 family)
MRFSLRFSPSLALVALLAAQAPDYTHFEVASVKVSAPYRGGTDLKDLPLPVFEGGPETKNPTRLTIRNLGFSQLLIQAYQVKGAQLAGPDWAVTPAGLFSPDKYDIAAVVPAGSTKQQMWVMLQNLLVERFHLRFHRETREATVAVLLTGKNGHRLQAAPEEPAGSTEPRHAARPLVIRGGTIEWNLLSITMASFANSLSGELKIPVENQTGLTGKYDIVLEFADRRPAAATESDTAPDLFAAVQAQLGLRLERRKAPVEMFVVDSADRKPTEN